MPIRQHAGFGIHCGPVQRVRTKLCGMMRPADARAAADAGADAIGMILHASARRKIDHATARAIVNELPPYVTAVGVFVDASPATILETAGSLGLSTVQLHGAETPSDVRACAPLRVIKAVKVDEAILDTLKNLREAKLTNLIGILLESPVIGQAGGTGVANDFERIVKLQASGAFRDLPSLIISGGLTPENVGDVVARTRPYAVDVSSGIEIEIGQKSAEKMQRFVRNAGALR